MHLYVYEIIGKIIKLVLHSLSQSYPGSPKVVLFIPYTSSAIQHLTEI